MHRGRGFQAWESIRVAQMLWILHPLIVAGFPKERKCISPRFFRGFCEIDQWNLPTQKHEEPYSITRFNVRMRRIGSCAANMIGVGISPRNIGNSAFCREFHHDSTPQSVMTTLIVTKALVFGF